MLAKFVKMEVEQIFLVDPAVLEVMTHRTTYAVRMSNGYLMYYYEK